MSGYIVKDRHAEFYFVGYSTVRMDDIKAQFINKSADRNEAKIMDYEESERIAHDVGGVVLARHEVFDAV